MGQRISSLKNEALSGSQVPVREIKIIYEDIDDCQSSDKIVMVDNHTQKKVSSDAYTQSDLPKSDRVASGIQCENDVCSALYCTDRKPSINSVTECTGLCGLSSESNFAETQCTVPFGSWLSREHLNCGTINKVEDSDSEVDISLQDSGSHTLQQELQASQSCSTTHSPKGNDTDGDIKTKRMRYDQNDWWERMTFSSPREHCVTLNNVESGRFKMPVELWQDKPNECDGLSTGIRFPNFVVDGNHPDGVRSHTSLILAPNKEKFLGNCIIRPNGDHKNNRTKYDYADEDKILPSKYATTETHSLSGVMSEWQSHFSFADDNGPGRFSPLTTQQNMLFVTANSSIAQRGNIERLTMFTVKSDPLTKTSDSTNLHDKIIEDSLEAKLLPECLQLINCSDCICNRMRSVHKSFNSFIGGNVTVEEHPTKRKLHSADFIKYNSISDFSTQPTVNQINLYSYQFWILSEPWVEKAFKNPLDRRIESIGRISDCRIRLTNKKRFSPRGFQQRLVSVVAPSAEALVKCCKLFDDKFPHFYATSGVLLGSSCIKDFLFVTQNAKRRNQNVNNEHISNSFCRTSYQHTLIKPNAYNPEAYGEPIHRFPSGKQRNTSKYYVKHFSNSW